MVIEWENRRREQKSVIKTCSRRRNSVALEEQAVEDAFECPRDIFPGPSASSRSDVLSRNGAAGIATDKRKLAELINVRAAAVANFPSLPFSVWVWHDFKEKEDDDDDDDDSKNFTFCATTAASFSVGLLL
uniref:Uncharacterized protein n=1 Tax=Anopheles coluzzii TaxID=1518534 RepID=A0A8W7PL79_ANOCL